MFRTIPSPFLREETIAEVGNIYRDHAQATQVAAPVGLPVRLVSEHWNAIEHHKWLLSERLGRDVGMQVAAADYLENITNTATATEPHWLARFWNSVLTNLDADGPNSIAQLERTFSSIRFTQK